jgi:hypothetical protein
MSHAASTSVKSRLLNLHRGKLPLRTILQSEPIRASLGALPRWRHIPFVDPRLLWGRLPLFGTQLMRSSGKSPIQLKRDFWLGGDRDAVDQNPGD